MEMSKMRGHEVYCKDGVFYYSDTNEPTVGNNRDCGHCNKPNRDDEHDVCISELPGVMNACCGHGEPECAYVQFPDSTCIRGEEAVLYFESLVNNQIKEDDCMSVEDRLIEKGGYCEGCRSNQKISELKEKGYVSCCPERTIVLPGGGE